MTNPNVEDTLPVEHGEPRIEPTRHRRWPWLLVGLGIVLIGLIFGSFFGYQRGLAMRLDAAEQQLDSTTGNQFELARQDYEAGRLDAAQRRIEYILQLDPSFSGGKELLTNILIARQLTSTPSTPTPQPSPTLTPTPDTRSVEQMYEEARAYLAAQDWDSALKTLESLRNTNIDYRSVDVDGLYYIALTNRGIQNILNNGSLEIGIYDLTLAEKIGPLDVNAGGYRRWARLYLNAASYWDVDWEMVVSLFADIYPALPGLRDSSGMTATERYRLGLIGYGDWLGRQERWCDAEIQYQAALQFAEDTAARAGLDKAAAECRPPTNTAEPMLPTETPTPTLEGGVTTEPSQPAETVIPGETQTP